MSKHVINQNQLQMFMRPHEIKNAVVTSVDIGRGVSLDELWEKKAGDNSVHPRFVDDIRKNGVQNPVILQRTSSFGGFPVMGNGHHRVQAAADLEAEDGKERYIPVEHDEDYMGSTPAAKEAQRKGHWNY